MDEMKRKRQFDIETIIRWVIGSVFWTICIAYTILLANQFWSTIKVYSEVIISKKGIESIVTLQGQVNFVDRASLFILTFVVAALVVYLFFKFIEPNRADEEIFLIEGHEYFKQPWFERIHLVRMLKLFVVTTLISLGIYLVLWVSVLLLASLT